MTKKTREEKVEALRAELDIGEASPVADGYSLKGLLTKTLDESSKPENWVPMYAVGNGTSPSPLNPNQRPAYWQNDKAGLQSTKMPACCVGVYDEYGFRVKK